MSSHSVIEKCFEDAEDSGLLRLTHKGLKCFPNFVDDYDLVDVLVVGKDYCITFDFHQPLLIAQELLN